MAVVLWLLATVRTRLLPFRSSGQGTGRLRMPIPNLHHILHKKRADTASAWPAQRDVLIG